MKALFKRIADLYFKPNGTWYGLLRVLVVNWVWMLNEVVDSVKAISLR
jgi:hypothetical protein